MAQSGYTPILIYASGTATNLPLAADLTSSASGAELALNYADGKLYFKNNSGVVTLLAQSAAASPVTSFQTSLGGLTPSTATTGVVTLAGTLNTTSGGTGLASYTAGDLAYYASGTALTKLGIGTANQVLTSSGTAPQWSSAITVTGVTDSGNLTFTGTGNRITGDFSNATLANRVAFQTSTVNGNTSIAIIPNGTSRTSNVILYNTGDTANSSRGYTSINAATVDIVSDITGTGTYLPTTFYTGGSERIRIDTSGNVGIGTASPNFGGNSVALAVNGITSSALNLKVADANALTINCGGAYTSFYDSRSVYMSFATSATERMRIDSSGNLLVGTSVNSVYDGIAQSRPLVVQSSSATTTQYNSTNAIVICNSDTTTNNASQLNFAAITGASTNQYTSAVISCIYGARTNTVYPSGILTFATSPATQAPVERMRIDSSGNVGIGANNTGAYGKFGVIGTSYQAYYVQSSDASGVTAIFAANSSSEARIGTATNHPTAFYINGTEKMRIDSSGNVGIGTSSPSNKLDVTAATGVVNVSSSTGTNYAKVQVNNTGGSFQFAIENSTGSNFGAPAYSRVLWNDGAYPTVFYTTSTERMRIDTSGNLLVGASSFITDDGRLRVAGVAGVIAAAQFFMGGTGANSNVVLSNGNGQVGTISTNGSTTIYGTSSDYRLKENIAPMTGALAKVALLKPCTYKWKVDGSDGQGFIAHELAEVEAGCVTGEKDATREEEYEVSPAVPAVVDADGIETTPAVQAVKGTRTVPSYQGVDTSFLVATLTAAIQEAHTLIIQLQADVAALKR